MAPIPAMERHARTRSARLALITKKAMRACNKFKKKIIRICTNGG
jgi:hypothetical protein